MYPLDFEEFLWTNGINDMDISSVKSCFENEILTLTSKNRIDYN